MLSNGNLTIVGGSQDGTNYAGCRSNNNASGKVYFEVTQTSNTSGNAQIGIANAAWALTEAIYSSDTNYIFCVPYGSDGVTYGGGTLTFNGTSSTCSTGDVYSFAIDMPNKLFWVSSPQMRIQYPSGWNSSTSSNPATGSGGNSFSGMTLPAFIAYSAFASASMTINTGQSAFNQTIPAGFAPWDFLLPPYPVAPTINLLA